MGLGQTSGAVVVKAHCRSDHREAAVPETRCGWEVREIREPAQRVRQAVHSMRMFHGQPKDHQGCVRCP